MSSVTSETHRRRLGGPRAWVGRLQETPAVRLVKGRRESGHTPTVVTVQGRPGLHETIILVNMDGCAMEPLAQALEEAGYAVCTVQGLPGVLERLQREQPSLIIVCGPAVSDASLALRQATFAPILALVPGATEAEVIEVLNAGVDDCQMASIGTNEVVLRVRAIRMRSQPTMRPSGAA